MLSSVTEITLCLFVCLFTVNNLMTDEKCEANRDTKCKCKPGYYCKHSNKDHCDHCDRVSLCPPGNGVIKNRKQYISYLCESLMWLILWNSSIQDNVGFYVSVDKIKKKGNMWLLNNWGCFSDTHLEDTKCSPCPAGTYSNVTDYISSCKNHTR